MIRILLADDHPVFRRGLELVLSGIEDFQVCAVAVDGLQVVQLAAEHHPEVVLMDLRMPGLDGIAATMRITAGSHPPAVLMLSMFGEEDLVFAALRAGARGYLLKGADEEQLERAVRAVAAGQAIFDAQIAARLLADITRGAAPELPALTSRELQVLRLMDRGLGNAAIALELGVAVKTVRNHVSNILLKLQVRDRGEATRRLHQRPESAQPDRLS